MATATTTKLLLTELQSDGQLLRFKRPLEAELEVFPGEGASIWAESLQIGATGESESELLDMFAALIITVFHSCRTSGPDSLGNDAKEQCSTLLELTDGIYVRQA